MTTQHQEPGVGTPAPHTEAEAALGPDEFDDRLIKTGSVRKVLMSQEFGAAVAALLIFIGFSIAASVFATRQGIGNFLDPAATLGIMTVAVALLMIGGEFDLSSGVMIGSTALVTALVTTQLDTNVWFGIAASLIFALIIGFLNGFMCTRQLPSFIITLSTYFMLWGLNYAVTTGLTNQVAGLPSELFKFFLGAILLVAVLVNLFLKKRAQS